MTIARLQSVIALQFIVSISLALSFWYLTAGKGFALLIGTAFIPVIWLVVATMERRRPLTQYSDDERHYFSMSVIIGGAIIVASQAVQVMNAFGSTENLVVERGWGVLVGLILAAMGNAAPKILPPLDAKTCAGGRRSKLQRFAGLSLLIGGVGYAGAWLFAPIEIANVAAMSICLASVLAIALRAAFYVSRKG
ncbi:MAG: hypothetical protein AAGJ87_02085 [Pseudomonadota bacterium]